MKKPDFVEMIHQSFLSSEKKQELTNLLKTKISESVFFETLDHWLAESLVERKALYERTKTEMEKAFQQIEALYKEQREKQDLALEESIKSIDVTDFLTKKSVMDAYYSERAKEEMQNEEAIKQVIADTIKTTFSELSES